MGKPCSCMQYIKKTFLLQVTRESVSGTTSHTRIHIRYYKSRALRLTCNESEGSYDEIIITIVASYTGKNITCLLLLALLLMLRTRNNSDGNKLMI